VSHGIVSAALFLCVGVVYDRMHSREISTYGGLVNRMPVYAAVFMVFTLANVGLPGTSGFVGEFLILLGTFRALPAFAVIGMLGVILSAVYMLWMYQRVIFGEITNPKNKKLVDLDFREKLILLPLVALIFWMGIYSESFLRRMDTSVNQVLHHLKSSAVVVKN